MNATIDLKLFATLASHLPANAAELAIEEGATTIRQLIDRLEIPLPEAKLIFVNGVRKDLDTVLHGGDRVGIFPPVGGG
jgi:molybdopterin converting factor small subunit